MADEIIPASPTSVKLITKRKSRSSRKYGFNKRKRLTINYNHSIKEEESSSSIIINSNNTSPAPAASTTTAGNQSDCNDTSSNHIIKTSINLTLPQEKKKININYLYDEEDDDLVQQSSSTRGIINDNASIVDEETDIFACAKLLEIANKKAITPKKSKSKTFNNITGKFISLNEHNNHNYKIVALPHSITILDENIDPNNTDFCQIKQTSQLIVTNSQNGKLCKDVDNVQCDNQNVLTSARDVINQNVSVKRTIKETILCDFNVNSPSPVRSQKEQCLVALYQSDNENIDVGERNLILNLKQSSTLKTYSKIRQEKCIKRKLFGHKSSVPSSPSSISSVNSRRSSINHEWLLNDLSGDDCSENECGNTSQKRIITSSLALDLNKSQNLIENIQNLSSYYESQSAEKNKYQKTSLTVIDSEEYTIPKATAANCDSGDDDDNENRIEGEHVTLKTNFETIIFKSITSDNDDNGDNGDDDDVDKALTPKILQINESNIYKTILDEDSDLFRQFISPGKITNDNLQTKFPVIPETNCHSKPTVGDSTIKIACGGNGFTTGRGIKIPTTSDNLNKSINFFNEDFGLPDPPPTISAGTNNGFSTGRGTKILISASSLQKSTKIFEEEYVNSKELENIGFETTKQNKNITELKPIPRFNNQKVEFGFSTGRGNQIKLSESSKQLAEQMFNECSNDASTPADNSVQIGFSTGRGKQVKMSENAKQLAEKMFNDCSNEISLDSKNVPFSFSTGRHQQSNPIPISKDAQKRATNLLTSGNDDSDDEMQPRKKIPSIQFSKFKIEDKNQKLAHKLFQDCLDKELYISRTTTPPQPITSGNFTWNDHPHKQNQSPKMHDLKTPINNNRRSIALSMTQEITASTKALLEDEEESYRKTLCRPIRLSARFTMTQDCDNVDNENDSNTKLGDQQFLSKIISEPVRLARQLARQNQISAIHDINKKSIQPRPGSLYLKKLISTKLKWHELVSNKMPISQNLHHTITTENIDNFHFNMSDYLSEKFCMENTEGIQLADGIIVHMNNENQISFPELENGFLSCPFVDYKLLHKKWCRHHLQFIILKLASMENAFPQLLPPKSILNLENVMLQLKYRYDREIDNAEHSALRKIIEFNNASTKSMILYVNQLSWNRFHDDNSGFGFGEENLRMELSDGWYKISAKIDESLEKMVKCGKIKNGTKLILHGAEILGLNKGCSPFEIPSNVRLKIHGNSTRRCRWDTKLGFYKHQNPLKISLNSILPNGGLIGRIIVCILRVSPVMYVENLQDTSDNSKMVISERVYRQKEKQQHKQTNLLETIEKLYSQVTREYETEEQKYQNEYTKLLKNKKLHEINDPDELFFLLNNSNDPESFESELTSVQKYELNEYQIQKNHEKNEEIQRRVREKLNNTNGGCGDKSPTKQRQLLTKFIKIRIIDVKQPKQSAILTMWNPNDELLELIKEKQIYEITNISAAGIRYGDLQLSAGKRSNYKRIELLSPSTLLECNAQKIIKNLYRKVTQIDEIHTLFPNFRPQFNEFDTVGIIVLIGPKSMVKKNFQPIYIVDKNKKMLCVNFWDGIDLLGYDDLIKIGNLLAIKNLQWRTMSCTEQLPKSFASEYSIFSSSVTQENHCRNKDEEEVFYQTFIELQNFIKTIDLPSFINDCQANLDNILSTSSSSTLSSSLSTPNNLKKIKTMTDFNNSPHTPPTPKITNPALYASTPITRRSSLVSPLIQNNNNTFSHTSTPTTTSMQSRIDRLNAYGQPPPISPIVFSKRNNFLFNRRILNKTKPDKNTTV